MDLDCRFSFMEKQKHHEDEHFTRDDDQVVLTVPSDKPIPGYKNSTVITIYLWTEGVPTGFQTVASSSHVLV